MTTAQTEKPTGLEVMRLPFPDAYISKLPKGTKAQNDCPASEKVNCKVCGGWHHPRIVHLDYVGHAAITQRLLDADPMWNWEPLAFNDKGLPMLDDSGCLWIKLTVAGHTRLGFGDAQGKHGPNAMKEAIGDAIRNAAMRFGAALDLWHKGNWEVDSLPDAPDSSTDEVTPAAKAELPPCDQAELEAQFPKWQAAIDAGKKTAQAFADMAATRFTLTDAQRAQILALAPTPAIDAEFVQEMEAAQ